MAKSQDRIDLCRERARTLVDELVENHELYFSNGYLNSEGMKVLGLIGRILGEYCPEYMLYVKRARKTRRLEDVLKVAGLIWGEQ